MFRKLFESVVAGHVKVLVGGKNAKLDNSYVHNLIHGFILAAEHLVQGGTAPGQAYFINDGEPINMFEFARPVVAACGQPLAEDAGVGPAGARCDDGVAVAAFQVRATQAAAGTPCGGTALPGQLLLDREGQRDLGYRPLFTTEQAMDECLPYYIELFEQVKVGIQAASGVRRLLAPAGVMPAGSRKYNWRHISRVDERRVY